jgi:isopentenyl diphosphate isomerase/L-lactate dehydrogenase-like FMN-dependent dehydrogenase
MRGNRELYRILVSIAGVVISLIALLATTLQIKGLGDNNAVNLLAIASAGLAAASSVYVLRIKERFLKKKRVFVIYSHKDQERASDLVKKLREEGFDPWFDKDEITPGQKIEDALISGLAHSAAAILLVSKNTESPSRYLSLEIDVALSSMGSKNLKFSPIIPVRLDEQPVPKEFENVSWIQLESDEDFKRLVRGLHMVLEVQSPSNLV